MITEIRLKKGSGVPSSLKYAELAIDMLNKNLYIGATNNEEGGSDFIKILDETAVISKISENKEVLNSLKYYGDANITPSDSSLFSINVISSEECNIGEINTTSPEELVIPYQMLDGEKKYTVTTLLYQGFLLNDAKYIILPNTITIIEDMAFWLANLRTITIPKSVKKIGNYAFMDSNVMEVYYGGSKAEWDAIEIDYEKNPELKNAIVFYNYNQESLNFVSSGEGLGSIIISKTNENVANGDYSIVGGYSSNAITDYSVALGYKNISGSKGFYIRNIDYENKKIYLSNTKYDTGFNDSTDNTDVNFITPEYDVGDEFSILGFVNLGGNNENHFHFCGKIKNIINNVIEYENELPFTELLDTTEEDFPVFLVPKKPNIGSVIVGTRGFSEGDSNIAGGFSSHAEGRGNIAAGSYAHVEGRNNKAGYSSHAEGISTNAMGIYSHSEGETTQASGRSSHAEAKQTKAIGDYSHAEGVRSQAIGTNSHAEGQDTVANSSSSHVEGVESQSNGKASHAEGIQTIASGYGSHTEGYKSSATKDYSHAEGQLTNANEINSHAEGLSTTSSGVAAHSEGSGTTASGDYSHSEGSTTIASAYASHSEGYKSIASAGYSHAEGRETTASAQNSHSEGYLTQASGSNAHAEGRSTIAKGLTSHTEGGYTIANGDFQHVQGKYNIEDSISKYAHIVGNGTADNARSNAHTLDWNGNTWYSGSISNGSSTIIGLESYSSSFGIDNLSGLKAFSITTPLTISQGSVTKWALDSVTGLTVGDVCSILFMAEDYRTEVWQDCATIESIDSVAKEISLITSSGAYLYPHKPDDIFVMAWLAVLEKPNIGTVLTGLSAHSEGRCTKAIGDGSHGEGGHTVAVGRYSHSEGNTTKALNAGSHAEGTGTIAKGVSSHTEGNGTEASGGNSHAEGYHTKAIGTNQHVQGRWNIDSAEYAHIVGNGTADDARSNAHTLDWAGNACFAGDVYVNGADMETGKKLATEEYVNNTVLNTEMMNMINNLHYYCNKDIKYDESLFEFTEATPMKPKTLMIKALSPQEFTLVIPPNIESHYKIQVLGGDYIEKIIIPRNTNLYYQNGEIATNEDLKTLFPNLKTIVRIDEDGVVSKYNVEQ